MDRLHRELFTIVLSPSWSHGVEAAIDVTLLSRYYERYADHAVTIARRIIHVVTGEPYADTTLEDLPAVGGVHPQSGAGRSRPAAADVAAMPPMPTKVDAHAMPPSALRRDAPGASR